MEQKVHFCFIEHSKTDRRHCEWLLHCNLKWLRNQSNASQLHLMSSVEYKLWVTSLFLQWPTVSSLFCFLYEVKWWWWWWFFFLQLNSVEQFDKNIYFYMLMLLIWLSWIKARQLNSNNTPAQFNNLTDFVVKAWVGLLRPIA